MWSKFIFSLLYSILWPNTPHIIISLEPTIVTGGFYLSSHTLYETLIRQIHSFILPTLLTEGTKPPLTIFICRIVHYMHSAYVMNDSSEGSHLLIFSSLDDTRDLFSLISMAILLNVLDERMYQLSLEGHQEGLTTLQQCWTSPSVLHPWSFVWSSWMVFQELFILQSRIIRRRLRSA